MPRWWLSIGCTAGSRARPSRAIFDVKQGAGGRQPWASKRCPNNADPDPSDTTAAACLTDGQISTIQFIYSRYAFASPLANGVKTFGMWLLGVTGFLMRNLAANPLDYVEGGPLNGRRRELSSWLDSTSPDLTRFATRGGKMIVTIGTDDTLASPGARCWPTGSSARPHPVHR